MVRGSSSHTGALALKAYFEALMREQVSPIITPDGPRGPRFKFKPGAILLAQMSGRPMLPLAYAASRASLIKWDKFVLPWPGARIAQPGPRCVKTSDSSTFTFANPYAFFAKEPVPVPVATPAVPTEVYWTAVTVPSFL